MKNLILARQLRRQKITEASGNIVTAYFGPEEKITAGISYGTYQCSDCGFEQVSNKGEMIHCVNCGSQTDLVAQASMQELKTIKIKAGFLCETCGSKTFSSAGAMKDMFCPQCGSTLEVLSGDEEEDYMIDENIDLEEIPEEEEEIQIEKISEEPAIEDEEEEIYEDETEDEIDEEEIVEDEDEDVEIDEEIEIEEEPEEEEEEEEEIVEESEDDDDLDDDDLDDDDIDIEDLDEDSEDENIEVELVDEEIDDAVEEEPVVDEVEDDEIVEVEDDEEVEEVEEVDEGDEEEVEGDDLEDVGIEIKEDIVEEEASTEEEDITNTEDEEEEKVEIEYVTPIEEAGTLSEDDIQMAFYEGTDPSWTVLVKGSPVAVIRLSDQPDQVANLFSKDDYAQNVAQAMVQVGVKEILTQVKARYFANKVDESQIAERLTEKIKANLDIEFKGKVAGMRDEFKTCMATVLAGMNKNFWRDVENPLKGSLFAKLEDVGISNPDQLIETAFAESADAYFDVVLSKAIEFMDKPTDAREEIAKAIGESNTVLAQSNTIKTQQLINRLDNNNIITQVTGSSELAHKTKDTIKKTLRLGKYYQD